MTHVDLRRLTWPRSLLHERAVYAFSGRERPPSLRHNLAHILLIGSCLAQHLAHAASHTLPHAQMTAAPNVLPHTCLPAFPSRRGESQGQTPHCDTGTALLTYCPTPACLPALLALHACQPACLPACPVGFTCLPAGLPCLQWGIPEGMVVSAPCEDLLRRLIVLVRGGRGRVGLRGWSVRDGHPLWAPCEADNSSGVTTASDTLPQTAC